VLRIQIKNYFPYELRHRIKPENPLSSSRSARINVKLRSGPMISTDLLNWMVETKSPLVQPHPCRKFYNRSSPPSHNSFTLTNYDLTDDL